MLIWIAGFALWRPHSNAAPPQQPPAPAVHALEATTPVAVPLESTPAPRKSAPVTAPKHRRQLTTARGAQAPALVRVRSSVGLPLLWVEVSVAGEDWQRVDLPQTGLEVEPEAYPLRIRAAGHVETDAPRGEGEIVLEPDALLTVESAHIRTWAKRLATFQRENWFETGPEFTLWGETQKSGILAEFPDSDHLLVAFSPAVLARAFPGDVDVSFRTAAELPIEILLRPVSGLRASWSVPAGSDGATAPLDLEIEDEGERPDGMHFQINELDPPSVTETRLEYPWGSVRIGRSRPPSSFDLRGRASRTRVEALALGRRYYICGRDSNGRYGLLDFVHDGSERKIVLQAPYTIVGRVVDAGTAVGLPWPDVRAHPPGTFDNLDWWEREGPSDEQGGFELHLPGMFWGTWHGKPSLEAPERIVLEVSAEGHRSVRLEFSWDGRRRVDVGEIALEKNVHPIVIAGNDLVLQPWADISGLTFGDEPALEWDVRHVVHRAQGDHELELAIASNDAEAEPLVSCRDLVSGESSQRPFVRELGELLLCASARDEALAFRRGEGGIYHQVPRSLRHVSVECASLPEGGAWTLGWSGGGTWAAFRKVSAKGKVADGLALPELATELWWSAGEAPADLCKRQGGVLALDEIPQTLVLR